VKKISQDLILLVLATIASTLFVWLPFACGLGKSMLTVFANYDGPNYLVIAKTLYQPELIRRTFSLPIPLEYYPAHLPGYPFLIKLLDSFMPGTWAMLLGTLITSILAAIIFYLFIKKFKLSQSPLFLSILFLFLPARWLVVRSVGSPEPLFIFALLASFYFFKSALTPVSQNLVSKKKIVTIDFLLAGIFGGLAQITKTPGILLFIVYGIWLMVLAIKKKKIYYQSWPLLLMPVSLLAVFFFYYLQTGDFLAYFHSGDNFHLVFPPFQAFATGRNWLGDFWLEDMVYVYLFGALTVILLFKQKLYDLAAFAAIFFTATLFVAHRDLSRYSLPLMPFALIALAPFLEKKEFKIAFLIILPAIYFYTLNFILHNVAPIADWSPYL
jgi:4-amino-4-deoxy-L-arabinose transferase-like glycosyltransferase